jgi:NitT/TauT family transport system permease protein
MPSLAELLRRVLPPCIAVLVLLALWQAAVAIAGISPFILPAPTRIAAALWQDRSALLQGALLTAQSTLLGFLLAATVGVVVGSLLSASRRVERAIYPLTLLFQMVPLVAIAPVLVIWLDNGAPAVIAASAIVAVFPVIANTLAGLRAADPLLEELFDLYSASAWQRWTRLRVPSAIPSVLTGLRIAAGLATIGAVVGEFVAGFSSDAAPLGMVITASQREFRTDRVFAAVLLASLVGFALFAIVSLLSAQAERLLGTGERASGGRASRISA